MWTAMPPTSCPISSHSPVCIPIRTSTPRLRAAAVIASALRRAREGGQEAVADGLDLAPAKARELIAHVAVVLGQQVAPAPVADPGRVRGRVDDVGEHHCQQSAHRLAAAADAGEELLDLID